MDKISIIIHTLFNTILVSIPEEFMMITAMLLVSYYFKIVDLKKDIIFKTIPSVITIAFVSNLLRVLNFNDNIIMSVSAVLFYILVLNTYYPSFKTYESAFVLVFRSKQYDITFLKIAIKMFFSLLIVLITCAIFEFTAAAIVVNIFNTTLKYLQDNLLLTILVTLPERIIQVTIIYLFWKCVKFDIIKMNLKSNSKSIGFIVLLLVSFFDLANAARLIIFERIFESLDSFSQVTMIFATVIFPVCCILFAYFRGRKMYYVAKLEYEIERIKLVTERMSENSEIKYLLKQIDTYLKLKENDRIYLVIQELERLLSKGV